MDTFTIVKRNPFVVPMAVVAAAAMMFISEGSYWQSVRTLDELGVMQTVRLNIHSLAQGALDAETGQHGYLLTGRKEYLRPYENALKNINEAFNYLDLYYHDEPTSKQVLEKLHSVIQTKLSEIALTIRMYEQGKADTSADLILSNIGKEQMEAIRALSAELLAIETFNIAQRRAAVYQTLMLGRIGVAVLSAISLLALFLYLRQTSALERQRDEQKRLLQTERDRLEVEVAQRTAQLTELTHHLQTAREDERNRLARNLHDELGALLTSAKLDAARLKPRLAGAAPEARERLDHLVGMLNSSIALGRRIIEDLRPSTLSNLGLVATLEIAAREFAKVSSVDVHCALSPVKLEPTAELVVYRVVQEAITNITKYAKARHVWLSLESRDGQVEVSVRDDGIGFDTARQPSSAYGLVGMRFRVEAEGGSLHVVSAPRQGTLIQVKLPESTLVTT